MSFVTAGEKVTVIKWRQSVQQLGLGDTSTPGECEVRLILENENYVLKVWSGTEWLVVGNGQVDAASVGGEDLAALHAAGSLTGNVNRLNMGKLWEDSNSGYSTYPFIQTGRGTFASLDLVTFAKAFTTTPRVVVTAETNASVPEIRIVSVTTSGFTPQIQKKSDSSACSATIHWMAIGQLNAT